ncbi:hypothetical protein QQS45_12620 [Alteriqipengyuania flavescens]|uniref:hypothetical protein n=1 Tax=Alteriqipengyuania flavescens TaxID=3053610 RepID=UPI0025B3A64D|nr:hypothetical protein [Alteriqipengyuania flavescens]WJY18442.1 hypothetical protein QQW98_12615 [Alteriqipengyuania flavescens]WJY24383.1 hypothetical protein QQS45_12620 [Alteriqipengyuania flavescens]
MTKTNITRASVAAAFLATSTLLPIQANAQSQIESRVNCQGADGCVLPIGVEEEAAGVNWLLPALLGLAAIVGAIILLSDDDDDDEVPVSV